MYALRFNASEEAAADAVVQLAAGTIGEEAYAGFLRANIEIEGGPGR